MTHHRKRRRAQRKTDGTTNVTQSSQEGTTSDNKESTGGARSGRGRRRRAQRPAQAPDTEQKKASPEQRKKNENRKPLTDEEIQARAEQRQAEIEAAPYIAITAKTSGIHPSTGKLIVLDAVTLSPQGEVVDEYNWVFNPGADPGPKHLHGLSHEEVKEQGKRFAQVLKQLGRIIDDRTVLVHGAPYTWGFIVQEARTAMSQAARANRSRSRQRGRRRQRVGHIPKPLKIVDTLATARRQGGTFTDTRIRSVAGLYKVEATPAEASTQRAGMDARDVVREETLLVGKLYFAQKEGFASDDTKYSYLASYSPDELRPDRFGLQRSELRVDAAGAPRSLINPGVYTKEGGLVAGMEIVVSPEISMDPDELIEAIMKTGLAYSEKITRKSSAVICNKKTDHVGKAMHAVRKDIPLLTDEEFMKAVENVAKGTSLASLSWLRRS